MAYRDEIDYDNLKQRDKDLIDMIDRKIAAGLEDCENGRMYTTSEVLDFLGVKEEKINLISNDEIIGAIV